MVGEVIRSLERALGADRLYRDAKLTLQALAAALAVTPHQLSWVVNQRLQRSFTELVNGYRLAEVERRLANPEERAAILEIAFDAGFGTKGAFNRVFKSATGMTPSDFRRRAVGSPGSAPGHDS